MLQDASGSSFTRATSRDPANPHVLKRYQACHQCRKRKLKCDAKRPCSTCVRSHAHAVSHPAKGAQATPPLNCTFDPELETIVVEAESSANLYDRLESRINELETIFHLKNQTSNHDASSNCPPQFDSWSLALDRQSQNLQGSSSSLSQIRPDFNNQNDVADFSVFPHFARHSEVLPTAATTPSVSGIDLLHEVDDSVHDQAFSFISQLEHSTKERVTQPAPEPQMIWPNWPPNLPNPGILRHLIEVFFTFQPHARRLFHAPSFMASLLLPPSDSQFPIAPVLHAICSVSPMYTAAVSSPPLPNFAREAPDEIFQQRYRIREKRQESFAEEQARRAQETIDVYVSTGEHAVQIMQANVVLSWYFWSHAKWSEVWITSGHSLRMALPLGLNKCPPFDSILGERAMDSFLPPAKSAIEDETRRNLFWLAYTTDRITGTGHGWAFGIDDEDIGQFLPVRGDLFDSGSLFKPTERQWAHTKDVLLVHPPDQCDSFSLYIKGTFLITRVKNFNRRFRSRYYVENPFALQSGFTPISDARKTQAFKELDNILLSFRNSFPTHLKDPFNGNVVDVHLYSASLFPLACSILLHEPHANVRTGCMSALRILAAAHDILDLIYALQSTSYDITLLDPSCSFGWLLAGRVLSRFLQVALETDSKDQISALSTELGHVQLVISKVGERIPLAYSHARLLHDFTVELCGTFFGYSQT